MVFSIEWLAGFFDGEGTIGVYPRNYDRTKTKRYYVLVVCLAQSGTIGKQICEKLQQIYGGSVSLNKGKGKPQWKWYLSANKAADFLYTIKPYLINKKEEAELGFVFQGLSSKGEDHPEAQELAEKIKQCKVNY